MNEIDYSLVGQVEEGKFDENAEPLVYYGSGLGEFKPN